MTAINLGMPAAPPPALAPRRTSRQIMVGSVPVGGGAPVSVQSMTTTLTADVNATLQQIAELTAVRLPDRAGRRAVSQDDADALPVIARKSQIPVIADIHFQPKYVFAAIDAGCAAVRVNPGNIKKFDDQVERDRPGGRGRRGTRSGSASTPARSTRGCWRKYGKATAEALVESALWECSLFEEHGFRDIKISVKHNDPVVMVRAYRLLAERCDYPLHLGVTEAGPAFQGTDQVRGRVRRAAGRGHRRHDPGLAVRAAGRGGQGRHRRSCESLNLRAARAGDRLLPVLRSGPGRRLHARRAGHRRRWTGSTVPLRVAVMGCVVNGPGEAREADLGVASGNGKGQIFVKGEVIKTVPESQIVETLIEEALRLAEEMGVDLPEELAGLGGPTVTVH